jgi:hypothetical protein
MDKLKEPIFITHRGNDCDIQLFWIGWEYGGCEDFTVVGHTEVYENVVHLVNLNNVHTYERVEMN